MKIIGSYFILISFTVLNEVNCSFEPETTLHRTTFSDDEERQIGKTSGDIVNTSTKSESASVDKAPISTNHAGAILDGLEEVTPKVLPQSATLPKIDVPTICKRDYSTPCPKDYTLIGDVEGNGDLLCAPITTYDGPCIGNTLNLSIVKSSHSRKTWAQRCMTDWPCESCVRQYSNQCPEKWEPVEGSFSACTPTGGYFGPCRGSDVDFSGYNNAMREDWSQRCNAWWACSNEEEEGLGPDPDMPLTKKATIWRVLKGYQ